MNTVSDVLLFLAYIAIPLTQTKTLTCRSIVLALITRHQQHLYKLPARFWHLDDFIIELVYGKARFANNKRDVIRIVFVDALFFEHQ